MSNEITAYFKGTSGVSESVYQFDYGMILIIDGPDLTAPFEVHFEHTGGVDAVTAIGQDNRVAIPNACLALPGRVTAYIYDHTGQHDGQTAYVVRFQVMNRARPVDEMTDEQDSAISKAIALLAEPIDNIETIVNEALAMTGTTLHQLEDQFNTAIHAVTTDTEVTNIRVGDDGVTYSTAGHAVRKQFSNLKSDLNAELLREDLFSGWKQGYYASSNGNYEPNHSNYVCTVDPIPLTYREGIFWNLGDFPNKQHCYMHCYDSSMNHIASAAFSLTGTLKDYVSPIAVSTNFADVAFVHFSVSVGSGTITPSTAPPLHIYKSALGLGDELTNVIKNTAPYTTDFTNMLYEYGAGRFAYFENRIGLRNVIKAKSDITISVLSGYKYAVFRFSSDQPSTSTEISSTGWITEDTIISKGEYFLINLAKIDDSNLVANAETCSAISIKPNYIVPNDLSKKILPSYVKGTFNANGNIDTSGNGVVSDIILGATGFTISGRARVVLALFSGTEYIGKINSSGGLDKVAGDWKWFVSGSYSVTDYLERYDADSIVVCILPTDSTTITTDTAQSWGEEHCEVASDKYLSIGLASNMFAPKRGKDNYVIGADLLKKGVDVKRIGLLAYLQAFCIYNGKYYSIDGSNIAEQDNSFTVLRDVSLYTGHGNGLQLGSNGIAYASGWNDNRIYAVDLENLEVVNTITLPTTGYTTCVVDEVRNYAYIFQRDSYPDHEDNYNFIVYDMTNQRIISTKKILAFGAMQAADLFDDKIIVLNGLGNTACPNGYRVFDLNGNILAEYVFGAFQTEPEGVCVDRDTNELYISLVNKYVYKITA